MPDWILIRQNSFGLQTWPVLSNKSLSITSNLGRKASFETTSTTKTLRARLDPSTTYSSCLKQMKLLRGWKKRISC